MVKLVDTLDLGSSAARLGGSSPSTRTELKKATGFTSVAFFNFFHSEIHTSELATLKINPSSLLA